MVTNPTAKTSRTSEAIAKPTGAPAPGPLAMASGTLPPITVRGAAAAITMNTMAPVPSFPWRFAGAWGLTDSSVERSFSMCGPL